MCVLEKRRARAMEGPSSADDLKRLWRRSVAGCRTHFCDYRQLKSVQVDLHGVHDILLYSMEFVFVLWATQHSCKHRDTELGTAAFCCMHNALHR
jgi:hypothetical protein